MLRVVKHARNERPRPRVGYTEGQLRTIAQAVAKAIGVTVAEQPERIKSLLVKYRVRLSEEPGDKELIARIMDKLAHQHEQFNNELGVLIEQAVPGLNALGQYDHFDLEAAGKEIGGSTASGAMGGGIWGAALGAVGGVFNFASTTKQQSIEKEKASAMSFSSLVNYKAVREQNKGVSQSSQSNIVVTLIISAVLLVGVILVIKNMRQTKKGWKESMQKKTAGATLA